MNTGRMKGFLWVLGMMTLFLLEAEGSLPRWRELNQAAAAAAKSNHYQELRQILLQLKPFLPGNPRVIYNLAASEARLGQGRAALADLRHWARMGLVQDISHDDDFASLIPTKQFAEIVSLVESNKKPIAQAETAFTLAETNLIPEDLAYDPKSKSFFVSSVREAKIIRGNGKLFAKTEWPVFALAIDASRRLLWATSGWVPHCRECKATEEGQTVLLAFNLDSGVLTRRLASPVKGLLGDMTVSRRGDIYVSEGIHGGVFLVRAESNTFERLDQPGEFPSPQTPALSADEKTLFIPDYVRGIAAMNLQNHITTWLQPAEGIALSGIDGLYMNRNSFVAVQNGTNPPRVVRFSRELTKQEILEVNTPSLGEPTHGVVAEGYFYFIANSGWDQYDEKGKEKAGSPPVQSSVQKIHLWN